MIIHKGHEYNKKQSGEHCALFWFPLFGYCDNGTGLYYGFVPDTFLYITMMTSLENTEVPG